MWVLARNLAFIVEIFLIEVLKVSEEVLFILSFMQPMFEFVKFQPDLVTETKKSELGRDR